MLSSYEMDSLFDHTVGLLCPDKNNGGGWRAVTAADVRGLWNRVQTLEMALRQIAHDGNGCDAIQNGMKKCGQNPEQYAWCPPCTAAQALGEK